jgi:hypothetical protein
MVEERARHVSENLFESVGGLKAVVYNIMRTMKPGRKLR